PLALKIAASNRRTFAARRRGSAHAGAFPCSTSLSCAGHCRAPVAVGTARDNCHRILATRRAGFTHTRAKPIDARFAVAAHGRAPLAGIAANLITRRATAALHSGRADTGAGAVRTRVQTLRGLQPVSI